VRKRAVFRAVLSCKLILCQDRLRTNRRNI
jgi:hypothetical protein